MVVNLYYKFGIFRSAQIKIENLSKNRLFELREIYYKCKDIYEFKNSITDIMTDQLITDEGYDIIDSYDNIDEIADNLIVLEIRNGEDIVNELSDVEVYIASIVYNM